ncbi:methyltransferase [Solihabitans fulvus]|uniref:Methyltransferase n=1 Tax=Solihabitans fulvus TaxID=1892852 RepID=A0A5B2XSE8_9PSEU|nr:methyltransferase [Solihabitans fulvus]KAA2265779.1 methyltransferase [Solihabitans fulvus]
MASGRRGQPAGIVRIDDVGDLITPMAVRVAATLRLAEHIGDGVDTVDGLAAKTAAHRPSLGVLIRHLVSVGVFTASGDRDIALTTLGRQLRLAQEFLDADSSVGRSELSLVHLVHSVRTGEAAYPRLFGATFWEDLTADPRLKASFDSMTDRHLRTEIGPLLAGFDWASIAHVVDLGSGNAELLVRLLSAFDGLRGTFFDLPGNTWVAERNLARAGLTDRCAVVGGDFFQPLTGVDPGTLVLNSVLHDWNDEETSAILGRCGEALRQQDRLLIVDSFTEDGVDDTRMDLRMLALFGGRQRTIADMARLAEGSGLRVANSQRLRKKWLLELAAR